MTEVGQGTSTGAAYFGKIGQLHCVVCIQARSNSEADRESAARASRDALLAAGTAAEDDVVCVAVLQSEYCVAFAVQDRYRHGSAAAAISHSDLKAALQGMADGRCQKFDMAAALHYGPRFEPDPFLRRLLQQLCDSTPDADSPAVNR